jgi:hypothetical protein
MAETTHVKGLDELQKFLDTVAPRIEKNIMRGALRAGMNKVKPVAQSNIHSVSGLLAKGLKIGTRSRGGTVTSNLKATGPHGFVAKFIEYGVKPHTITAREGSLFFGNTFAKSVQHPGFAGRGFMRNALDVQAEAAVVATGEYVKSRLTKEGLDVAHIQVEGDE